jgi:hypothetical protein
VHSFASSSGGSAAILNEHKTAHMAHVRHEHTPSHLRCCVASLYGSYGTESIGIGAFGQHGSSVVLACAPSGSAE